MLLVKSQFCWQCTLIHPLRFIFSIHHFWLKSQCLLLAQFWLLKIPIKVLNPLFSVDIYIYIFIYIYIYIHTYLYIHIYIHTYVYIHIYIWSPCNPFVVAENPNHPILDQFSIRTHGDLGYSAILAPTAAPTAVSRRSCEPPWAFPASSWSPWHFLNGGDSGYTGGCKVILTLPLSRTDPQALINHS